MLMVAFQDESIHDMLPLKWGTTTKLGVCPQSQLQIVTEHNAIGWTYVYRKLVKVKVNTFMYGQWVLATGL